jgi:hypothetical protein
VKVWGKGECVGWKEMFELEGDIWVGRGCLGWKGMFGLARVILVGGGVWVRRGYLGWKRYLGWKTFGSWWSRENRDTSVEKKMKCLDEPLTTHKNPCVQTTCSDTNADWLVHSTSIQKVLQFHCAFFQSSLKIFNNKLKTLKWKAESFKLLYGKLWHQRVA